MKYRRFSLKKKYRPHIGDYYINEYGALIQIIKLDISQGLLHIEWKDTDYPVYSKKDVFEIRYTWDKWRPLSLKEKLEML